MKHAIQAIGSLAMVVVLGIAVSISSADPIHIPIGTGSNQAYVSIVFNDGAEFVFDVSYNSASVGLDLLDIIQANSTMTYVSGYNPIGGNDYLIEFDYDTHIDTNDDNGPDNFWRYWTAESEGSSWVTATDPGSRIVSDGIWDGYVFGSTSPPPQPAPEPATIAILCLGTTVALIKRNR